MFAANTASSPSIDSLFISVRLILLFVTVADGVFISGILSFSGVSTTAFIVLFCIMNFVLSSSDLITVIGFTDVAFIMLFIIFTSFALFI